jgi:hypothetical protein
VLAQQPLGADEELVAGAGDAENAFLLQRGERPPLF